MGSWLPLRWRVVAPALAALAGAPGRAGAQDSSLARFIHRTRLDNGLDVITVENNTVPLATVLVAVRNGAFTQDSADQGLAHLYEHMLFHSYRHDPSAFAVEATYLKGRYNGGTGDEGVYYYVALPANNVDGGIRLSARLIQQSDFTNGELKAERPVVLDELQRDESDPEERLERQVSRAVWGTSRGLKDGGGRS